MLAVLSQLSGVSGERTEPHKVKQKICFTHKQFEYSAFVAVAVEGCEKPVVPVTVSDIFIPHLLFPDATFSFPSCPPACFSSSCD